MRLETPLGKILRTTDDHVRALEDMGLRTVQDLLLYLPRAHEDLSQMQTIATAAMGEKATLRGTVADLKLVFTRTRKRIVTATFTDTEGMTLELVWFNQPHIKRMLSEGDDVVVTGKLSERGRKLLMQSPTFEVGGNGPLVHAGRLVPIYPQHDIINTKWLRQKMQLLKDAIDLLPETLPSDVIAEEKLPTRSEMVRWLHFPETPGQVERAMERIAFEEMFAIQKDALERKMEWQGQRQERLRVPMDVELIRSLFASLKFTPTDDQRKAIYEILRDMEQDRPMSRLLEGDVGSGKTLVATAVMANAIRHGGQCALMVPTEVLARQHADSIGRMLINFSHYLEAARAEGKSVPPFRQPGVALLTGSLPFSESAAIKRRLATSTIATSGWGAGRVF